jgi:ribosome biogenesis GTPase
MSFASDAVRLESFGWSQNFAAAMAALRDPSLVPARVVEEHRDGFRVAAACGELRAEISGRLRHDARGAQALPAVGDWAGVDARPAEARATIRAVLPRRSSLVRKAAGRAADVQVVAANLDLVLIATSLDGDLNASRIARYAALAWEGGAQPVVLLTKSDLSQDVDAAVGEAMSAAPGAEVLPVSAATRRGLDELHAFLRPASTSALVGSSGVGKSTLVNALCDAQVQAVGEVRAHDGRGRHTTTARRLLRLPWGALVVDTPGMREVGMVDGAEGLAAEFDDVETFASSCRFRDCNHEDEPDCAVRSALQGGSLGRDRLEQWRALRREAAYLARRDDVRARLEEKRRWKTISKSIRRRDELLGRGS